MLASGPRMKVVVFAFIGLLHMPSWAQTGVAAAQVHLRQAGQAYRDGDLVTFANSLETAPEWKTRRHIFQRKWRETAAKQS